MECKVNEDNWQHIGNWSINFSWQQEWNSIPKEHLVFFTTSQAELDAIDNAFDENDLTEAQDMLASIGVNIGK